MSSSKRPCLALGMEGVDIDRLPQGEAAAGVASSWAAEPSRAADISFGGEGSSGLTVDQVESFPLSAEGYISKVGPSKELCTCCLTCRFCDILHIVIFH